MSRFAGYYRQLSDGGRSVHDFFQKYFDSIDKSLRSCDTADFERAVQVLVDVRARNAKVIIAGNGGSAAMASHVCMDLTKVARVRAVNFNEADLITCLANDYGYDRWMEKAIEYYSLAGDVVILISSSGRSPNILRAAETALRLKLQLITFSGFSPDNPLRALGELNFFVENRAYNIVEMTHHVWLLALVDRIVGRLEYAANEEM